MYKIIIIGSGLAGIAAAKKLIARGIKPIILDTGVIPKIIFRKVKLKSGTRDKSSVQRKIMT